MRTVLSYGMGTESTAILLRWLREPATRPCPLEDLLVVTAMTGDEFDDTASDVTLHILPLLREHGVRFVQVARKGHLQEAGIVVLDDSRSSARLHAQGVYKLSDELLEAGTIPTTGGVRKCSQKFKGWVIDTFLMGELQGAPFRHVMGFNADEPRRVAKDRKGGEQSKVKGRQPSYPLVEWGWDRARCEAYIQEALGVAWKKSCCRQCPFAAPKKTGWHLADRYRSDPQAAADALWIEHVALSLNPEMRLYNTRTLLETLVKEGITEPIALHVAKLEGAEWALYRVRRVFMAQGVARRAVERLGTGDAPAMLALLQARAQERGLAVTNEGGILRAYVTRRAPGVYPVVEEMLVAAPAVVDDKIRAGFEKAYEAAV